MNNMTAPPLAVLNEKLEYHRDMLSKYHQSMEDHSTAIHELKIEISNCQINIEQFESAILALNVDKAKQIERVDTLIKTIRKIPKRKINRNRKHK